MQAKSRKRAAKRESLDRPFDPAIFRRARELACKYRIVLEPNDECGYLGSSLEMPNVYADGPTVDECVKNVREAIAGAVAYLIETGKAPPLPPEAQVRDKQVNVRVTAAERQRLRAAAVANGFSDTSEYIRNKVFCV